MNQQDFFRVDFINKNKLCISYIWLIMFFNVGDNDGSGFND